MSTTTDLRRTPVRKGKLYCSPACGHGCTYAEYLTAQKRANDLAKEAGGGWMPRVWENLGWHYSATKGKVIADLIDASLELHVRPLEVGLKYHLIANPQGLPSFWVRGLNAQGCIAKAHAEANKLARMAQALAELLEWAPAN